MKKILYANNPVNMTDSRHINLDTWVNKEPYNALNTGDYLVCEATHRMLGHHEYVGNIQLGAPPSDEKIRELADQADLLVIRGSNYLMPNFDLGAWADVIEKIDLPVAIFGLGAQYPTTESFKLPRGTKRFLKVLEQRSIVDIGTRGYFTESLIREQGVKKVQTLGCPTVVRSGKPEISIKKTEELSKWGFTINRHLTGDYSTGDDALHRVQRNFVQEALADSRGQILSQGEYEETVFLTDRETEDDIQTLLAGYGLEDTETNRKLLKKNLHGYFDTGIWTDHVKKLDFVFGYRLHGNLIGLGAGVPALFFDYDSRTKELIELLEVPSFDIQNNDVPTVNQLWQNADFSDFERKYKELYANWQSFVAAVDEFLAD